MSTKEAKRLYVMERVLEGSWAASEAAKLLGLSIRQVFRLKGEMAANGEKGLVHKNRGRKPKHAVTEETRQLVIDGKPYMLYQGMDASGRFTLGWTHLEF